ncbi:hypothetical protein [Pyxidicoccus caerfyrddinensis]|uniref:hypothetical protein n=1 Tax=Pyxidicoccus caerfyrddinensis TaxID=2709663 RepID=UPI0013DB2EA9|nr:hypothetical protein [Pyxidicoccus caerfyrddinensis]
MSVHPRSLRGALVAAVSSSFALVLLLPALALAQAWQPSVTWNTYLGGGTLPDGGVESNRDDQIESVALALDGDVVVTGWTNARTFPADQGLPTASASKKDVFVARYSADGQTLRWTRVFGGAEDDIGTRVVVDSDGAAFVVGTTRSDTINIAPGTPAPLSMQYSFEGRVDAFLARVNPDGTLEWFMFLGSMLDDEARDIALGPPGSNLVYIVGKTGKDDGIGNRSDDTPVPFPPDNALSNERLRAFEAFVSQVDVAASGDPTVRWTRMIKSDENDIAYSVTTQGDVVFVGGIIGSTYSGGSIGILNSFGSGDNDGFAARVEVDGRISWFRYVGGSGDDEVRSVLARPAGGVTVVGNTDSTSAPVSGSGTDVFVRNLSADGVPVGVGLRVGDGSSGTERTEGHAAVDPYGNIYVGGKTTTQSGFAFNAFDSSFVGNVNNNSDGFAAMVNPAAEDVIWKSYVGGLATSDEWVRSLAAGGQGRLTLGGHSNAPDVLIANTGVDRTANGGTDGFLFSVAVDSTPPTPGTVSAQVSPQGTLTATWSGFNDPELSLTYEWGIDISQGTDGVRRFESVGSELTAMLPLFQPAQAGPFYVTVRATNAVGLSVTATSNSFTATLKPDAGSDAGTDAGTSDGGTASDGGTSDGGTGTDAGVADGGTDGGEGDGDTRSPLGWSCASGGSSGTLALTMLGVVGVLLAMRRERPAVARERARGSRR